jgi:Acyl-CoA dehydrogenase, C-terminal domain
MTAMDAVADSESEFLEAACQALSTDGGSAALRSLGWWELLPDLDDPEVRVAAFTVFRAQGRTLATSSALAGVLAQPYLDHAHLAPGTVVATASQHSPQRGRRHVVVGDVGDRQLLVDCPGSGASLVPLDAVELVALSVPGLPEIHEARIDWSRTTTVLNEADVASARARSTFLGRIALAFEMLGAAEGAVALAVDYAGNREQFGQPIGRF